jgi:AraC-like DNA-binding protein
MEPGYREFAPPPALRGALACLWVSVSDGAERSTRILPDACSDLVWISGYGAFVAGPDTGPVLSTPRPDAVVLCARFAPGAGGAALGLPLAELRDRRVLLADGWPELDARLAADADPADAWRELTSVAGALALTRPPDRAVRAAARRLAHPGARVRELAGELGLSERQLRRRCHAAVGYGPKTLHRVLRFRAFLSAGDAAGRDADLARLALEAGYADQSHLTADCTRLAGVAPAALLRTRAAAA